MSARFDVAVVGGGPAGAVLALRMAQFGHTVCVVERARFPRRRLGESLTPGVLPMLASLGVSSGVVLGAQRIARVGMTWDAEPTERLDPDARGLVVDRGVFDAALLAEARARGVVVRQPATVRSIEVSASSARLAVDALEGPITIEAGFVVDATGRSAGLGARAFASEHVPAAPRTFAVHGYFVGRDLPSTPSIEAVARGWCWGVPIPDGSYDAIAFVDEARLSERPRSLERWLRELVAGTSIGRGIEHAVLDGSVHVVEATAARASRVAGARWLRVGDAALTLDPLSSSGVQKAIQGALAGALVAHTLLGHPEDAAIALGFYEDHVRRASERHARWAAEHYASACGRFDDAFWRARAAGHAPAAPLEAHLDDRSVLRLSPHARVREVPCLGVDRVELRGAVDHPGLDGPAAFVGDTPLAPLLEALPERFTLEELCARWTSLAPGRAHAIARWLRDRGVLERAP
jgi:flavin-dependent dehydrogenase